MTDLALSPAETEEIRALGANQPVDAGYTISPIAMQSLVAKKFAFWWDEKPEGYVLTHLGRDWLKDNPEDDDE